MRFHDALRPRAFFARELEVSVAKQKGVLLSWTGVPPEHNRKPDGVPAPTCDRQTLEWLAKISTRHEAELRRLEAAEAEQQRQQEIADFVAKITEPDWSQPSSKPNPRLDAFVAAITGSGPHYSSEEWDPEKHPRTGTDPNAGWFASTGGEVVGGIMGGIAGSKPSSTFQLASGPKKPSISRAIAQRNQATTELTGQSTARSAGINSVVNDVQTAKTIGPEVIDASIDGLKTGGKAVVNGLATAVKNVATLGLSNRQIELLGVTDQDRRNGYNTAFSIATASGDFLIAVGTSGLASALSAGGQIARSTSGALVAYDAAGNAVGVIKGTYDAAKNGVTLQNGSLIAGSALGLAANYGLGKGRKAGNSGTGNPRRATFGKATSKNYRKTFFDKNPALRGKVIVHHAVEQQALDLYKGVLTAEEIHSLENLRGIPADKNSRLHLSAIRREWDAFYFGHRRATKQQLLDKATEIDLKYGHLYAPRHK